MTTWNRVCIRNHTLADNTGQVFTVERGKEYLTSDEADGVVTVFSTYWVKVPVSIFAGEERFT